MKKYITAILAILLAGNIAFAAEPVKALDDSKYSISVGDVTMTIAAGQGAKILSFTYKGQEAISQLQRMNAFGSTFWTSPQAEWNWPPVREYDSMPYEVEQKGNTLVMTGQKSERFGYRMRKEFVANEQLGCIEVTYRIINESGETRQVAPWEITRVPNDGYIVFDAPLDKITPADLIPFKSEYGLSWYKTDESEKQRKINADGKGWYAFVNNGLMLKKRFVDLKESEPAPKEAEIQVYVNEGKSFIELEAQGPYLTLKPGEALRWTVEWYLAPAEGEPSEALADLARNL